MRNILFATVAALSLLTASACQAEPDPSDWCIKPEVLAALKEIWFAMRQPIKPGGGTATAVPNVYNCFIVFDGTKIDPNTYKEIPHEWTMRFLLETTSNGKFVVTPLE